MNVISTVKTLHKTVIFTILKEIICSKTPVNVVSVAKSFRVALFFKIMKNFTLVKVPLNLINKAKPYIPLTFFFPLTSAWERLVEPLLSSKIVSFQVNILHSKNTETHDILNNKMCLQLKLRFILSSIFGGHITLFWGWNTYSCHSLSNTKEWQRILSVDVIAANPD